jgi:parallel beta-helix repeat protein
VNPSESIQAAINNATPESTIFVRAGTYQESLVINKSISLIGEDRDQTIVEGQNSQFIIYITADNVNIEGFTVDSTLNPIYGISLSGSKGNVVSRNIVEHSQQGIVLTSSSNNTISANIVTANTQQGIVLTSSSNNAVSANIVTANTQGGIAVYASNHNLLSGNTISGNVGGLSMYLSGANVFSGNTLAGNDGGEVVSFCNLNIFYHNNFYDAVLLDSGFRNTWDYGGEGNYWSNYTGHDRGDGIGNETYDVAAGNITNNLAAANLDHHPLMGGFSSFDATLASETYQISIISNSTVSDLKFEVGTETGNRIVQFNVTGAGGTVGFSRLAIPTGLLNTSLIVLVGEKEIAPSWLNSENVGFNYLYFTYTHNNQTVLVISSKTMDLYDQLLDRFLALNATYYQLLSNYTTQLCLLNNNTEQLGLLSEYKAQLETDLSSLNSTFNDLLRSYTNLLGNYSQLQQSYSELNSSYGQNQQNVRSLTYIFAAATAILIIFTVYLSKHASSGPTKPPEEKDRF